MNEHEEMTVVDESAIDVETKTRKSNVVIFDNGDVLTADDLIARATKASEKLQQTISDIVSRPREQSTGLLAAAEAIRARRQRS